MKIELKIYADQIKNSILFADQSRSASEFPKRPSECLWDLKNEKVLALRGQVQIADNWSDLRALEVDRDLQIYLKKGRKA